MCQVLVATHRIFDFHCSMWTLSWGIWDLVSSQGMETGPPALGAPSLNHWTTREFPWAILILAPELWLRQSNQKAETVRLDSKQKRPKYVLSNNIANQLLGFPGISDGKESACNAGDLGLIPAWGRSPGEGNGNPLQYSCLENPMDRGAWQATVYSVAWSWTQLKQLSMLQYKIKSFLKNKHMLSMGDRLLSKLQID